MQAEEMSYADAVWIAEKAERTMLGNEFEVRSADVLRFVERTGHSSYDCETSRSPRIKGFSSSREIDVWPASSGGEDINDPDIVLHYDANRRLTEIEISHASKRTDLDEIRRRIGFEEVRESKSSAA